MKTINIISFSILLIISFFILLYTFFYSMSNFVNLSTPTNVQIVNTPLPRKTIGYTATPLPQILKILPWKDVFEFLRKDHTNWRTWTKNYNCKNFTLDLETNARANNIYMWRVQINFDDGKSHMVNAVLTNDYGIVYIEPQTDWLYMSLQIGDNLCSRIKGIQCDTNKVIINIIDLDK